MPAKQPTPVMNVCAALLESVAARSPEDIDTEYDAEGHIPAITMADYFARWSQYTETGDTEMICAVMYVDRVCTRTGLALTRRNMHRVILSALITATKWREEHPFKMSHYAKVGGVSISELERLETQFVMDLDWEMYIEASSMQKYQAKFRRHPAWHANSGKEEEVTGAEISAPAAMRG